MSSGIEHSLLLLSVPTLKHLLSPAYLSEAIVDATGSTSSSLLILVFSPLFDDVEHGGLARVHFWQQVQRLLTFIHVEAARVAHSGDNLLLSVDVVLHGTVVPDLDRYGPAPKWQAVYALDGDDIIPFDELPISSLPTIVFPSTFQDSESIATTSGHQPWNDPRPSTYPVAALGGTFDHIHAGHKILLSVGAWIASEKLIVGVTDAPLLVNKSNADVVESLEARMAEVRRYGQLFNPHLVYDVVPISDVYGPTGWDANIQALVLSHETREGAQAIAKHREEHKLPPLETFVIDVISSDSTRLGEEDAEVLKKTKLSSTFIRQWIVDRQRA